MCSSYIYFHFSQLLRTTLSVVLLLLLFLICRIISQPSKTIEMALDRRMRRRVWFPFQLITLNPSSPERSPTHPVTRVAHGYCPLTAGDGIIQHPLQEKLTSHNFILHFKIFFFKTPFYLSMTTSGYFLCSASSL